MLRQHRFYLFLLLCINLVGCSAMMAYKGENKLEPRIHAFAKALRWSQFEDAQKFISMRNDQTQNQTLKDFEQIRVTKYEPYKEIVQKNPDNDSTEIISIYNIDYYHKGSYKMERQRYEQLWWYDDTVGTWFLDSDLPKFKQ